MKRIAAAIAFFASVTVCAAFEIGDGQYAGTYNDQNFDAAESKFNTIVVPKQNDAPVGTIISWSVSTDPEDAEYWLECDGRAVDPNKYPELYAMMTHTPDYRGRFLIGAGKDGRAVGTVQESNLARHDFNGAYYRSVELQSSESKEPYDCSYWDYKTVESSPSGPEYTKCYIHKYGGCSNRGDHRDISCNGRVNNGRCTSCTPTVPPRISVIAEITNSCIGRHQSCSHAGGGATRYTCAYTNGTARDYTCGTCPEEYTPYTGCNTQTTTCRKWIVKTCYKDSSTYYNHNITFGTGDKTGVPIDLRASSKGDETRPANYAVRYLIRAKKVE